jgi:hypothetical protein
MTRVLLTVLGVALTAPLAAQTDSAFAARLRRSVGERLVYEGRFGPATLGDAEILVVGVDSIRGREALHVRFRLTSSPFLLKINNIMESWFTLDSLTSLRFIQDNEEGRNHRYNRYEIHPDSGFYRQFDDSLATVPDTTAETIANPLDDAAFFFFVRNLPLEVGDRYELHRYFKPDRNPVVLEVLRREVLEVPAGRFNTIVLRPLIRGNGIFREGAEGEIWLTDDPLRRVVQIRSRFSFGRITLRLVRIERLDEPQGSRSEP